MTWADWLIIGMFGVSSVFTITSIGEPKKPTTPKGAAAVLVIHAALAACLIWSHS